MGISIIHVSHVAYTSALLRFRVYTVAPRSPTTSRPTVTPPVMNNVALLDAMTFGVLM